jgi:hypothetical protein
VAAFEGKVLRHAGPAAGDVALVIFFDRRQQQLVQLGDRAHCGHRDHMTATEAPYFAFYAALFMGALDPGPAEKAVKTVMGPQGHEALRLDAAPAF